MTKTRRIDAPVLWTVAHCAQYWGVSDARARVLLSKAQLSHVRAYPAEDVMRIERPGQGARMDLRRQAEG